MSETINMIDHPPHYQGAKWESIEIIEALGNQFRLGNALKYIFRHAKKNGVEDLKKARWYLEREFGRPHPAYVDRGAFDVRFWREHTRDFAFNFDIEDEDLSNAVASISDACFRICDRDDKGWRDAVHQALSCLNAYLLRPDQSSEAA